MWSLGGPSAALRSAALGAVLLALIEGIGIGITRMTAEQFKPGLFPKFLSQSFIKVLSGSI